MKYDENDNVKASYIYGTNRVSETLDNSVDKYYNYDIRGTQEQNWHFAGIGCEVERQNI